MTRAIMMIAAALTASAPALGRAQEVQPPPAPAPVPAAPAQPQPAATEKPQHPLRFSFQGQIGAGQTAQDVDTDTDLVYGAILGLHFNGPLGLEVDYQYAENDFSGTGGRAKLKQNGVFGHVRFDILHDPLVPFVYGGAGWVRYEGAAGVANEKVDRLVIPVGAGVEFHASALVVGARAEYQWNTDKVAGQHLDYWKAVGTIGFRLP